MYARSSQETFSALTSATNEPVGIAARGENEWDRIEREKAAGV